MIPLPVVDSVSQVLGYHYGVHKFGNGYALDTRITLIDTVPQSMNHVLSIVFINRRSDTLRCEFFLDLQNKEPPSINCSAFVNCNISSSENVWIQVCFFYNLSNVLVNSSQALSEHMLGLSFVGKETFQYTDNCLI